MRSYKSKYLARFIDGEEIGADTFSELVTRMKAASLFDGYLTLSGYMGAVVRRLGALGFEVPTNVDFLPNEGGCLAFVHLLVRTGLVRVEERKGPSKTP